MVSRAARKKKQTGTTAAMRESAIVTTTNAVPSQRSAKVKLLSSKVSYRGPLFSVHTVFVLEPGGVESRRDVIHHSGSVVVLAIDESKSKRDPYVLMEEQYRHAAGE